MIVTTKDAPTHIKLKISDIIMKCLQIFVIIFIINCWIIIGDFIFNFLRNVPITLNLFNILFVYEAAILLLISPLTISLKYVQNKVIEEYNSQPKIRRIKIFNFLGKLSFITKNRYLEKELIIKKSNFYGIVGLFTGIILVLYSIIFYILFI